MKTNAQFCRKRTTRRRQENSKTPGAILATRLPVARAALHHESTFAAPDVLVLTAKRILLAQFPRFGYCCIQVLLKRRGRPISADRAGGCGVSSACRWRASDPVDAYRSVFLGCGRRRRHSTSRATDFVFDGCVNSQHSECLTGIDEYTRERPAIQCGRVNPSAGVIRSYLKPSAFTVRFVYLRSSDGSKVGIAGNPEAGSTARHRGGARTVRTNASWQVLRCLLGPHVVSDARVAKSAIEQWRRPCNGGRPRLSLAFLRPQGFQAAVSFNGNGRGGAPPANGRNDYYSLVAVASTGTGSKWWKHAGALRRTRSCTSS